MPSCRHAARPRSGPVRNPSSYQLVITPSPLPFFIIDHLHSIPRSTAPPPSYLGPIHSAPHACSGIRRLSLFWIALFVFEGKQCQSAGRTQLIAAYTGLLKEGSRLSLPVNKVASSFWTSILRLWRWRDDTFLSMVAITKHGKTEEGWVWVLEGEVRRRRTHVFPRLEHSGSITYLYFSFQSTG